MRLVRKFIVPYNEKLDKLCIASKNLYNQGLVIIKDTYEKEGRYVNYYELEKIIRKDYPDLFKSLKAQVSQQTLMILDKNYKSFFKSIIAYQKHPEKFSGKPRPPKFKKDRFILIIPNQSCSIKKDRTLMIDKKRDIVLKIPKGVWIDDLLNFKQVRVLPKRNYFEIEIIYEKEQENHELDYDQYASIDLGLNNFITMIDTVSKRPLIINGKPLKAINQWYNKQIAKFQSIKDKMGIKKYTKKMDLITDRRNRKIDDYLHKASRLIVNYLLQNKIGNLVIGYNKNWKQKINMGKRNNQNFVEIPYERLIRTLEYKCQMVGIKFIETEESYTSKVDALSLEELKKHNIYLGKRVKRGLFQSSIGKLINADVNGALNILRKVVHDSFFKRIVDSGFWFNPVKIRNLFEISSNSLRTVLVFNNV